MSRTSSLVFMVTGLAAATCVPSQTEMNAVKPHFLQHSDIIATHPAIASADAPTEHLSALPISVVVTVLQRRVEPPVALEPMSLIPRDRKTIGRQLQMELKRVGCYDGNLNGAWTTSTRQAMKTFIDRVNARLPTDMPDSILLALVQSHPDKVCGKGCPEGQGLTDMGSCLPNGLLARTSGAKGAATITHVESATPAIIGWTTTAAGSTLNPPTEVAPTEGRMALAGPTSPASVAPKPKTAPARAAETRQPVYAERGGSWAHNLFMRQDRAGIN